MLRLSLMIVCCWSVGTLSQAEDGVPRKAVIQEEVLVADETFAWSAFINEARAKYMKQRLFRDKAQRGYREALAQVVKEATEVHVFLLDSDLEKGEALPPSERFPITPYGKDARILKVKVLKNAEGRELAAALSQGLKEPLKGAGDRCHLPEYGVRIFRKDELPFQSSFCWECENYYVDYPDQSNWQVMGPQFEEVRRLLQTVLPK